MNNFTILMLSMLAGSTTAFTPITNNRFETSSALFQSTQLSTETAPAVDIFQPANEIPGALTRPVDAYGRMNRPDGGPVRRDQVSYPPGIEASVGSEVAEIITQQKMNGIHCHSANADHSRHLKQQSSFF